MFKAALSFLCHVFSWLLFSSPTPEQTFTLNNPGLISKLLPLYDLVERRIPTHKDLFAFQIYDDERKDAFTVRYENSRVFINCSSTSACTRGLYTFLTQVGSVDLSWTHSTLNEMSTLPLTNFDISGESIVKWRYHFNTCTFSYTTVWWNWEDWEYMLDWLALRGGNLPLAWVGYEYFLISLFREYKLSDDEICEFLSGPAFQTWNRFGNIQGSWGGSLPFKWVTDQFDLQKRIIKRMVDLGMTPVLPAFTGFVPKAFAELYPKANIVNGSEWNGFGQSHSQDMFLEPNDPLFSEMQNYFIQLQIEAYGNVSHIYTLDQFNENTPLSGDLDYLRNLSAQNLASLKSVDKSAIWLLQGWLFFDMEDFWSVDKIEAFLSGVPIAEDILILDLFSEAAEQWQRTNSYFGKPWVWCLLHDYGGVMGFEGNLRNITTRPLAALNANSTMQGMGLTMEGQEGNELIYDMFLDQAWQSKSINIQSYLESWVRRRYGPRFASLDLQRAWGLLKDSVYNNPYNTGQQSVVKSIIELRPNITGLVNRVGHHGTGIFYHTSAIVNASKIFHKAARANPSLLLQAAFKNDIVDITRQMMVNAFIPLYLQLIDNWNSTSTSKSDITRCGSKMVSLMRDLDSLLAYDENFTLKKWVLSSEQWAGNDTSYAAYLRYNAINQVTLWGPDVNLAINDYASKQWAGLISGYYIPRWEIFIQFLIDNPFSGGFNYTALSQNLREFETGWQNTTVDDIFAHSNQSLSLLGTIDLLHQKWI